jgi:hypothetical protein
VALRRARGARRLREQGPDLVAAGRRRGGGARLPRRRARQDDPARRLRRAQGGVDGEAEKVAAPIEEWGQHVYWHLYQTDRHGHKRHCRLWAAYTLHLAKTDSFLARTLGCMIQSLDLLHSDRIHVL